MNRRLCQIAACFMFVLVAAASADEAAQVEISAAPLPVWGLGFSPDGDLLAAAAGDRESSGGKVTVWDTATWEVVFTHEHPVSVNCVAFSTYGDQLAAGTQRAEVLLFNDGTWELERHWPTEQRSINGACWTPDGSILTAGGDGRVNQWDAASGELQRAFDTWQADGVLDTVQQPQDADGRDREQRELWDVAVSRDGRWLVSGGWNDTVRLWGIETGQHLLTYASTQPTVQGVTFTADDAYFVAISLGGEIIVRETNGGLERAALQIGGRDVSVHPDSRLLAAAAYDGIRVFEINLTYPTDEEFARYEELLLKLEDDDIAVREATSEQIAQIGLPIEPLLFDAMYSEFAETRMRARRLWNHVRSPEPLALLEAHPGEPRQVAFSPDGGILASSSKGGDVLIWSVPGFELERTFVIERAP